MFTVLIIVFLIILGIGFFQMPESPISPLLIVIAIPFALWYVYCYFATKGDTVRKYYHSSYINQDSPAQPPSQLPHQQSSHDINDSHGRPLARINSDPNGNQSIYDSHGRPLGSYNKQSNQTVDSHGRPVAQGNALTSLIK